MSDKVVFWIGPVWPQIIAPAVPSDWSILTFDDRVAGGNGSDTYKSWALSLGSDPLSRLAPNARQILIAGFSRAHGAIEVFLGRAAANRDNRINSLVALDSYYSGLGVTQAKPGYLSWCNLALERNLTVIFTTSSGHLPTHQSASDSIKPLAQALGLRETRVAIPNLPAPAKAFGRGGVLWLDYQDRVKHEDHALKLAEPIFSTGVPFRSPTNQPSRPTQQAFAPAVTSPQVPTPPTTTRPKKPPPAGPGPGLFLGLLLVAGLGAAGYSLMRVRPKPKRLPEKNDGEVVAATSLI